MKKTILPLSKLKPSKSADVIALRFGEEKKRRILDLGIIPGTKIKVLQKSPLGNPKAYFIRGTVIALRNEDAEKIIVETL